MALSPKEIMILVNRWIGVQAGYLGDFSYRTHADFYPEYCDLDYNPYELDGTTRERFIEIVSSAPPHHQALIVEGALERFPLGAHDAPRARTPELEKKIRGWARRLRQGTVQLQEDFTSTEVVLKALSDAEAILRSGNAVGAVDRVHTALHGHLKAVAQSAGVVLKRDASITSIWKSLRDHHPAFSDLGSRQGEIKKVLNSLAAIIDAMQPIRNRGSLAHANDALLEEPEALLALNAGRSLLAYVDARTKNG